MPFCFTLEEGLGAELAYLMQRQLHDAKVILQDETLSGEKRVHQARRKLKRVRALYRFIHPVDRQWRASQQAHIRDIAASLSPLRDQDSLFETLTYLAQFASCSEERLALNRAALLLNMMRDQTIEGTAPKRADILAEAASGCETACDAINQLDLSAISRKDQKILTKTLTRTIKRARQALALCQSAPESERFHDLRKATQTYGLHISLLKPLWPSALKLKRQAAKTLADLLGHEHDLSILADRLSVEMSKPETMALFDGADSLSHLFALIIRQQLLLRAEALTLASLIFDMPQPEKPAKGVDEPGLLALLWQKAAKKKCITLKSPAT